MDLWMYLTMLYIMAKKQNKTTTIETINIMNGYMSIEWSSWWKVCILSLHAANLLFWFRNHNFDNYLWLFECLICLFFFSFPFVVFFLTFRFRRMCVTLFSLFPYIFNIEIQTCEYSNCHDRFNNIEFNWFSKKNRNKIFCQRIERLFIIIQSSNHKLNVNIFPILVSYLLIWAAKTRSLIVTKEFLLRKKKCKYKMQTSHKMLYVWSAFLLMNVLLPFGKWARCARRKNNNDEKRWKKEDLNTSPNINILQERDGQSARMMCDESVNIGWTQW